MNEILQKEKINQTEISFKKIKRKHRQQQVHLWVFFLFKIRFKVKIGQNKLDNRQ